MNDETVTESNEEVVETQEEQTTDVETNSISQEELDTLVQAKLEEYKEQLANEQKEKEEEERRSKLSAKEKLAEEQKRFEEAKAELERQKEEFRNQELSNYAKSQLLDKGFTVDFEEFVKGIDEKDIDSKIDKLKDVVNQMISKQLKESTKNIDIKKSNTNVAVETKGLSYMERLALNN